LQSRIEWAIRCEKERRCVWKKSERNEVEKFANKT